MSVQRANEYTTTFQTDKRNSWWSVCKWILFSIIKAWRSTKQGKEGCYVDRTCISIRCIWSPSSQVVQDIGSSVWKAYSKKAVDGAWEYTGREKWVLNYLAFLKSHIVRVASRQDGFHRSKLRCTTSTSTPLYMILTLTMMTIILKLVRKIEIAPSLWTVPTDSIPKAPKRKKKKTTSSKTESQGLRD